MSDDEDRNAARAAWVAATGEDRWGWQYVAPVEGTTTVEILRGDDVKVPLPWLARLTPELERQWAHDRRVDEGLDSPGV